MPLAKTTPFPALPLPDCEILPVQIRRLDRAKYAPILAMWARQITHWHPGELARRKLADMECIAAFHRPTISGLGAPAAERIAGFAFIRRMPDRFVLFHVLVFPQFRRLRVGWELMNHLAVRLDDRRRKISVVVPERNLAAQLFFRACGFRSPADGVWPQFFGAGEDAFVMTRRRRTRADRH